MPSEIKLIEKIKRGNKRAFKKIFDANFNHLFRFLHQFSTDKDLVEEWVQRAFIKAYTNISGFRGNSKFSTWLFKIGINEMKTDMRKLGLRKYESITDDGLELTSEQFNFDWTYDMKWLLENLEENKKAVFILHEVEGYSHSEISEMLDISVSASRTNLFRAKKYLKEKWESQEVKYDRPGKILQERR